MANPFDDDNGRFHVLKNARGEFSLWPVFAPVPNGWTTVLEAASRQDADAYVAREWTTLSPAHFAVGDTVGS